MNTQNSPIQESVDVADSPSQQDIDRLVSILWDIYMKLDPSERGFYTLARTQ